MANDLIGNVSKTPAATVGRMPFLSQKLTLTDTNLFFIFGETVKMSINQLVIDTSTESPATPGSAPPFRVSLDGTFKMENIHIR